MMKWMIAIALAVLPMPAMAQQVDGWIFSTAENNPDQQCFAMTLSKDAAFGFQAPGIGGGNGVLAFFGDAGVQQRPGDTTLTLSMPGKWHSARLGKDESDPNVTAYSWALDSFGELGAFPDQFHVTVRKGDAVLFDGDVVRFRAALSGVQDCVNNRS